jgi:GDP-L-fucose synthase
MIAANVIHVAYKNGADELSVSRLSPHVSQAARGTAARRLNSDRTVGADQRTNAIAKITGIKRIEAYRNQYGCDFINVMPTNLYGPRG